MDRTPKVGGRVLPLEDLRLVNELCNEYEAALRDGHQPDIAVFVDRAPESAKRKLLFELVALNVDELHRSQRDARVTELAAAHPQLANEIRDVGQSLASETLTLANGGAVPREFPAATPHKKPSRRLRLRCPHCSNHVELLADAPLDSVNCDTCGSSFSLLDRSAETRRAQYLEKIDRFELLSRLGVGGFGTVWKARDTTLDRAVAIKIPRRGQLSPEEAEQFFREARAVAQLRHPNIVPVHEVGREGDTIFIVSDLVRGISLADELSGHDYSPKEAATLVVTLAAALDHAHRAGIVHRDLKPSNVMLDPDGAPVLMDFGLAKREAEEVTMTVDGAILGTPAYMSPEQAEGRSARADKRTDVYSLGVILFELLTGGLPFHGNAQRQVQARLRDDAPDIRSRNPHLPRDLAAITAKCLERNPGKRYASADAVGRDLERFLSGRPVLARPISTRERARRWMARHPLPTTIASLVLLLAVAGPAAALRIDSQRRQLAELVQQKDRLISERSEEQRVAVANAGELQRRLDAWEGRANPFRGWNAFEPQPPQRQTLALMLEAQGPKPERSVPESDRDAVQAAQRRLALATLFENAHENADAQEQLTHAITALKAIGDGDPQTLGVQISLADAYLRMAALSDAKEDRDKWLLDSARVIREPSRSQPEAAPLRLAKQLEVFLTAAASLGFDQSKGLLEDAEAARKRLSKSLPEDPTRLYRLASFLAGRPPYLAMRALASDGVE